jgi:hypothetical protein
MKTIVVKKTDEINDAEWKEITAGFNEEFKRDKKPAELIRYYKANACGYSYHGIAKDESGNIAGFSSVMPFLYKDAKGNDILTGLSGSTFVKKEFRNDIFIFNDIYKGIRKACCNDNITAILGVPNKNSFKYLIKLLRFTFLYNLPYYVLPLNPSAVLSKKLPGFINKACFAFVWLYVQLVKLVSLVYNPAEEKADYTISYSAEVYSQRFNEAYTTVTDKQFTFTYRVYTEKSMQTAYLFHFTQSGQRTVRALCKAVEHIIRKEKIDLIIFVGRLDLKQALLLKLPESKHPQQLPLTVDVLLPESDSRYEKMKSEAGWNFGLMNFDVR